LECSLTVFGNRSFNATSQTDTTAPTSVVDTLPSYWMTGPPFQLRVNASDDLTGVASVDLYAAFSTDGFNWSSPTVVATDSSAPFAFSYSPPQGDGRYRFWSIATDGAGNSESLSGKPATGDIEAGLDGVAPTSTLESLSGYWQPSTPASLTATASDTTSGAASVQLYVSFSADNTSWSVPAPVASDSSAPFGFTFGWTSGNGHYRFWSIAIDNAGNTELLSGKPATGEFEVGADSVTPTASLVALPTYWQSGTPIAVQTTISDATSGVVSVDLYASFSSDGVTWSTPAKVDTDTASPFAFSYMPSQDGRYRLWALATDAAGNAESLGSLSPNGEVAFGVDHVAPTATVVPFISPWHRSGPLTIEITSSDAVSGVVSVALYVSFSMDGVAWSTPALAATDSSVPFQFTYTPDRGDGRYRFWAVATDAAGNTEGLPTPGAAGEAETGIDSVAPTVVSSVPASGASGVSVTVGPIRVRFSEPVDHAAAEARFSIAPSIPGAFSWDGNTLVFTPSASLAAGTSYRVTVSSGVPDVAGNVLGADYTISFATESAAAPPPLGISGTVLTALLALLIAAVIAIALVLRRRASRKKR
jgi:hypothetical protein